LLWNILQAFNHEQQELAYVEVRATLD